MTMTRNFLAVLKMTLNARASSFSGSELMSEWGEEREVGERGGRELNV